VAERVTHAVRDTVVAGTPAARATHVVRDTIVAGTPEARVTHMVRDVIVSNANPNPSSSTATWRD